MVRGTEGKKEITLPLEVRIGQARLEGEIEAMVRIDRALREVNA